MGKYTDAANEKKQALDAGQKQILDRLAVADENQMIVMGAIADLYELLAAQNGGTK